MKNPQISIIIPVYNAEKYIKCCTDSILSQPYQNMELIIVDDGSTDKSAQICDEIANIDARVRVKHKKNGGVSSARNKGIDCATGDYITFVDADDYLLPNTVTQHVFDGDFDLIQIPRTNGSFMRTYNNNVVCNKAEDFKRFIYKNFYFECWGRFYKRALIGSVRFPTDLQVGEDMMFLLNIYVNVRNFKLLANAGGYHYAYVSTSAMRADDIKTKQERLAKCVEKYYNNTKDKLALIIMVCFFYGHKVCDVRSFVYSHPMYKILLLPIAFKIKIKYLLDISHIYKIKFS